MYNKYWADMHSNPHHHHIHELEKWYEQAKELMDFWPVAYYPFYMRMTELGIAVEDIYDEKTVKEDWEVLRCLTKKANDEGYPMFMGYEWQGNGNDGDHNVFCLNNEQSQNHPMTYQELVGSYAGEDVIGIPHHVAYQLGSRGKNWQTHNEKFSPFAELNSSHGCSENDDGPLKMPRHVHMGPRTSITCYEKGLEAGYKVGCIASGDNHVVPAVYENGMMCALAKSNDKKDLWDALVNRRVYGVNASRIEVDFFIDQQPMGSVIPKKDKMVLNINVKGTAAIDRIEILKNNILEHMYIHSGTWERKKIKDRVRFKFRIEFGWGPDIRVYKDHIIRHWQAGIKTVGKILSVEKCWNNFGQKISRQSEQECEFELITYQSTKSGKWMGQSNVATEGFIFEIEAPIDSDISIFENGHEYKQKIADMLKDSKIIPLWEEVKQLTETTWGPLEHYRNDPWWHNAYKIKVHKAYPEISYLVDYQSEIDVRESCNYRIRVWQKNGDMAWSSPIFIIDEE